ncbi:hypothetical protein LguiB_035651 [Lonicera macranthoides]
MVVKMMKWRPWPPLSSKKFETRIVVQRLKGIIITEDEAEKPRFFEDFANFFVEVKWKGSKGNGLTSLRRIVRRNFTKEEGLRDDGVVEWNEEFINVCNFSAYKEGGFHPWEVIFTVFGEYNVGTENSAGPTGVKFFARMNASLKGLNQGLRDKVHVIATACLNFAEFASAAEEKETGITIPLAVPGGSLETSSLSLCLSLSFMEFRAAQEPPETAQILPVSPRGDILSAEKNEISGLKAGLRKVKIFKGLSARRSNRTSLEQDGSDGRGSVRSEDVDYNYPFDTDSLDDVDEVESEEAKEDSSVRKSFSYGPLAYANHAGGSFYPNTSSSEDENWIYYSSRKSSAGELNAENSNTSLLDQSLQQRSRRSIFAWRKRKLSFRSPKAKGEPLLKKHVGEEGGDDIDFDRRQFSSSDESTFERPKSGEDSITSRSSVSEFGDDNFAVGRWEHKEVISRDGHMKLQTQVFFASIDQRSERAAGESACTALVAVIADWFQNNRDEMPIKSQLDSLIREGSLEWRNLCENEAYRERFPDKHFDLDTVLEAKIRPLSVVPEKSFIGFFHPEGLEEEKGFDFLCGAMSFDNIWDEINRFESHRPSSGDPFLYIVSWNDHFFVLKVEQEAYYIIDTLGERLFEGCNQAYVLKFDRDTTIQELPQETTQPSEVKSSGDKIEPINIKETVIKGVVTVNKEPVKCKEEEGGSSIVCRGKESCKEYIKSFLAAIPIREMQADLKRGLMASSAPLHQRLQIEFHYTRCVQPVAEAEFLSVEEIADTPTAISV